MRTLSWINIALRGIMELGIVLALGYWGFHSGTSTATQVLYGIGAPVAGFGFWGLVDFRSFGRYAELLRLLQELVISGLAAYLLFLTGNPSLGLGLALLSIIHHAMVYALGERLLKKK